MLLSEQHVSPEDKKYDLSNKTYRIILYSLIIFWLMEGDLPADGGKILHESELCFCVNVWTAQTTEEYFSEMLIHKYIPPNVSWNFQCGSGRRKTQRAAKFVSTRKLRNKSAAEKTLTWVQVLFCSVFIWTNNRRCWPTDKSQTTQTSVWKAEQIHKTFLADWRSEWVISLWGRLWHKMKGFSVKYREETSSNDKREERKK